jgi:hypothetical protein
MPEAASPTVGRLIVALSASVPSSIPSSSDVVAFIAFLTVGEVSAKSEVELGPQRC